MSIDDTGFPKDGHGLAVGGADVLRRAGQDGQLPDRGERARGHRPASAAAELAAVRARESWDDTTVDEPAAGRGDPAAPAHGAGIPDQVRHREKWRLALDMLDEITGEWELPRRWPVVADAGYGDATGFRLGLTERGLRLRGRGQGHHQRPPGRHRPDRPALQRPRPATQAALPRRTQPTCSDLALAAGRDAPRARHLAPRHPQDPDNPTAAMRSHFLAIRVRPANRDIPRDADGSLPDCWLLAEWPPDKAEPTDYWLSNLPADTPLRELVRLAKIRWRIEHDYRELKDGLGLDHFEGRSYTGWHRHVTLAALAQAFCTLLRLDPKAPAPA